MGRQTLGDMMSLQSAKCYGRGVHRSLGRKVLEGGDIWMMYMEVEA